MLQGSRTSLLPPYFPISYRHRQPVSFLTNCCLWISLGKDEEWWQEKTQSVTSHSGTVTSLSLCLHFYEWIHFSFCWTHPEFQKDLSEKRIDRFLHSWRGFSCLSMCACCYLREWVHPASSPVAHLVGRSSFTPKPNVISARPCKWLRYPKVPPKDVFRSALTSLDSVSIANILI